MSGSHVMELPRRIVIGEGNMCDLGKFAVSLIGAREVALICGPHVREDIGSTVQDSLTRVDLSYRWCMPRDNTFDTVNLVQEEIRGSGAVLGIGGGRSVDMAKMTANRLGLPYISVPTAASHDGMASPFASIRGDKPHSMLVSAPLGVFVDISVIKKAPPRLLASGCGDLIANIIAVRDWTLGHQRTGEYYGRYSADLAILSANIIMENSGIFAQNGLDARMIVEALISAGVASCIAGSSRPCSGSEHLFSHALDQIAPGIGLHGEKCGIGSILMAKLHKLDWVGISQALRDVGAPIRAAQIGLSDEQVIKALTVAQQMRPERYTILQEVKLDVQGARRLGEETGVL